MLDINVTMRGRDYNLPNPDMELIYPRLKEIRTMIEERFRPVEALHPDALVHAYWNDDVEDPVPIKFSSSDLHIIEIIEIIDRANG